MKGAHGRLCIFGKGLFLHGASRHQIEHNLRFANGLAHGFDGFFGLAVGDKPLVNKPLHLTVDNGGQFAERRIEGLEALADNGSTGIERHGNDGQIGHDVFL